MKKLLAIVALMAIIFSNVSSTIALDTATSSSSEAELYKAIILSRAKIERDFSNWDYYNRIITNFFTDLRLKKDHRIIDDLENRLNRIIANYSWRYLNYQEEKAYNLVLNIYYRTRLLKYYILKWNYNTPDRDQIYVPDIRRDDNRNNNNNNRNNSYDRSLAYSYSIPSGWRESNETRSQVTLTDENYSTRGDTVNFKIEDYSKYSSFRDYFEEYKRELNRDYSVRNLRDSSTTIDGKSAYRFDYSLNNWDDKTIYLVEYNGMILVVNITKKYRNSSNNRINDIVNSIRIAKTSSELPRNNNNNNNNSNNNNNNNYYNRWLSYSYSIPDRWRESEYSNGEVVLTDENSSTRWDSVSFMTTTYTRYSSFRDFFDEYKRQLNRENYVRNLNDYKTTVDWREAYRLEYNLNSGDSKITYLVEYNNMILVINVTKKYRNSNNYKLDNLINSIRIDRKTSENSRNQEREISISDLIYRGNRNADTNNNNSNNNNNNNYSGSLAYAYSIPSGWREQNYSNGEVTLTDDNNYTRWDSVNFKIQSYSRFSSFRDYYDDYRNNLSRDSYVRNLRSNSTSVDWKNTYELNYTTNNDDEKTVYLVEYNNMVLVVEVTRKYRNSSNSKIREIIDSIRIARNSSEIDRNRNNNNNNNSNNYWSRSLSYNYNIPSGWRENRYGNGEVTLTDENKSGDRDTVSFSIKGYSNYSSFADFFENYKENLLRISSVRDFSSNTTSIDGKSAYEMNFKENNNERTTYLVEYNGMILIIDITRKHWSNHQIREIIDSVRINK